MKIAIMGAMIEEITPFLEIFSVVKTHEISGMKIYECFYEKAPKSQIFVTYSKIGKVYAAICASVLICSFKIDYLIFSGVAGGLTDLAIGDLVVVSKTCQHDVDISAFGHRLGFIPETLGVFHSTDSELNDLVIRASKELNIIPKICIAASGDQFISDQNKKDFIVKEFGAKVCDMESASVAVVCEEMKVKCCILRSISDDGKSDAAIKFDEFLSHASARSASVVSKMIELLNV